MSCHTNPTPREWCQGMWSDCHSTIQASEDAKGMQNRVSTSEERAGERKSLFLTPIAPHAARTSVTHERKSSGCDCPECGAQTQLLHIPTFLAEAELSAPVPGLLNLLMVKPAIHSVLTGHFPALGQYFYFTQKNHKTFSEIRSHYFILYFKKEDLLTTWLLYFLFTFHPFHSLSPPKILFAFLIRPIHQEKALRELVVTVPRSFSWAESINLHPWE